MANINYTATADLKSFSTWLQNNVDQNASTWDSTTNEGVLVLNSGVTEVGQDAFKNCTTITKVTISEGITSIATNAFNGASNLTYAEFPSTLTNLGNSAFWNNTKLNIVYCKAIVPPTMSSSNFSSTTGVLFIPSSVTSDYNNSNWAARFSGIYPYNGNGVITYHSSADLSNYSTWITDNAISTTYDSTTQIGTIEVFPYEIGNSAFQNCSTLTEISITNIISIGGSAFWACSGLSMVTLPESLTTIGNSTFYNCTSLTSVTLPYSLTTIRGSAFQNCTSLTQFTLPESLTTMDGNAFKNTGWWNSQSDGIIYKDNWCLGYKGSQPTGNLTISSCIHIIGNAFESCTNLTSVTLPNSLTTIGSDAFRYCSGLTSVTLPNSLTTINEQAFRGCTGLIEVTLPESLTTIGGSTFTGCTSLTTIYWNAINVTSYLGYSSVFGNTSIDTVIFGNSVIGFPNNVFQNCTSITSVTFGNSITSTGSNAFNGCTSITSVTFGNSITSIGSSTFRGCTGLTSVTLPDSLTTIGGNAFNGCTGLTEVTLPNSLTTIGGNAFNGCTGLTEVTLPNSLTTIGSDAFNGCTGLTTIYWNAINVTSYLGYSFVFGNTSIDTVIFGNSVTNIPNQAFNGCTSLTEVTLPESLTTIGNNAFNGCTNLLSVTSLATTPPTLSYGSFTASNDTLWVKGSSKSTYEANTAWRDAFTNIKGIYTVTTSAGQGGTITPTTEVLEGESFTVTATPNTHYKVSHFIVDGVDVGTIDNYTFQNLDANHTIHVDFELITHTITATAGTGGSISPSGSITINEGSDQTFTITPNAHYYISDVTVDGVSVGAVSTYTFTNVSASHTINATFTEYTHTITATAYEGGAIVPSGAITVNEGENQSFDIVPLEGYGILAVFIDGTQIEPVETYTFENVATDHTIQAMFYSLQTAGFNREQMLDIDYLLQYYLEQNRKRD